MAKLSKRLSALISKIRGDPEATEEEMRQRELVRARVDSMSEEKKHKIKLDSQARDRTGAIGSPTQLVYIPTA